MAEELKNTASQHVDKSPQSAVDVLAAFQLEDVWKNFGATKDDDKKPFFKACIQEQDFTYCVFVSEKIIKIIQEFIPPKERTYIIDGTFRIVPQGCFKKLLIFHVDFFEEKIFPFIFILMDKKTAKSYTHLFDYLDQNIFKLEANCFISDFEVPLQKSLKACYPNAQCYSCWFHFCQALRKNITTKHKHLSSFIRSNSKASEIYHKFMSIALLPAHCIEPAYSMLKLDVVNSSFPNDYFLPFLDNFENQWLKKVGVQNLTVFNRSTRTTSAIESYNDILGGMLPKLSDFFKFTKILQEEEFIKSRDFCTLIENNTASGVKLKRRNSVERAKKIDQSNKDLHSGKITFKTFLDRMVLPRHNICTEMEPFEDLFIQYPDAGSDNEDEDVVKGNEKKADIQIVEMCCVICFERPPNIVLLPCHHLQICNECNLKLQTEKLQDSQLYACPTCRQNVADCMQVSTN